MQNAHGASTPMHPNVKLDLAEDWGEKEPKDLKGYQAIVGSLMYAALATRPDNQSAVAALCRYNFRPFTSCLTAAKEFSSISNPPPTFDCILTAAAPAAMINSGATETSIGPMILPTANLKVLTSSFSATELSRGSYESKISSPCQPSKPNTSHVPRAPF